LLGLGVNAVVPIKTDKNGRMSVADLKRKYKNAIDQGYEPLMVNASGGKV